MLVNSIPGPGSTHRAFVLLEIYFGQLGELITSFPCHDLSPQIWHENPQHLCATAHSSWMQVEGQRAEHIFSKCLHWKMMEEETKATNLHKWKGPNWSLQSALWAQVKLAECPLGQHPLSDPRNISSLVRQWPDEGNVVMSVRIAHGAWT